MKHIKLYRIKIHRVENKTQVTIVFKVPFQNKSLFCQTLQQVNTRYRDLRSTLKAP